MGEDGFRICSGLLGFSGAREGGKAGGRERGRDGGWGGERKGLREGGREGGREGWTEGGRDGWIGKEGTNDRKEQKKGQGRKITVR